ncbi:hypothetical protein N7481_004820 [Penicillium waksmanii]|uniref:uncharacterized protein n=1 Tax=Penicillium waksmanii TaxID=69791 RepID=UPI002547D0C3|nr:uncharacterized protein N7481_004820 [Penicillium waksmanii]KAJ5989610.1 hypothetical protein N7481_004820 [Penicillium waksmanii]
MPRLKANVQAPSAEAAIAFQASNSEGATPWSLHQWPRSISTLINEDPRRYEQRLAVSRLDPKWSQGEWRMKGDGDGRGEADARLIGGYPDDSAGREALFPNRGIRGA